MTDLSMTSSGRSVVAQVFSNLSDAVHALIRRQQREKTRKILMDLPDTVLKDLGLTRAGIETGAYDNRM